MYRILVNREVVEVAFAYATLDDALSILYFIRTQYRLSDMTFTIA